MTVIKLNPHDPSFRAKPEFQKLTETEIHPAVLNVLRATDYLTRHDLAFTDPIETEYYRLGLAYTQCEPEALRAFMRATPEDDLCPIEHRALGDIFGGIDNPYIILDQ